MLNKLDQEGRRMVFTIGGVWAAFHVFGLAVWLSADSASPLVAALFADGVIALGVGLATAARRIFPDNPEDGKQ